MIAGVSLGDECKECLSFLVQAAQRPDVTLVKAIDTQAMTLHVAPKVSTELPLGRPPSFKKDGTEACVEKKREVAEPGILK